MNLRAAELVAAGAKIGEAVIKLPRETLDRAAKAGVTSIMLVVRLEALAPTADGLAIDVSGRRVTFAQLRQGRLAGANPAVDKPVVVRVDGASGPRIGDRMTVTLNQGQEHVFDAACCEQVG